MFCALNGATLMPRRASHRHSPAVSTLFPASDVVPATSSAPFTALTLVAGHGLPVSRSLRVQHVT